MNNGRRKQLVEIGTKLGELREMLELLLDEEQECFENLPESLQQGERGEAMTQAVERMEEALDAMEEAATAIEAAQA